MAYQSLTTQVKSILFNYLEVDLTQNLIDIEFKDFCIVYTHQGLVNEMMLSTMSSVVKGKKGNNSNCNTLDNQSLIGKGYDCMDLKSHE
jgi:hypothetical protein